MTQACGSAGGEINRSARYDTCGCADLAYGSLGSKLYKRTVALLADVASFRPYDDHMLSWALHIYDLHPPHPVDNPWYKTPSYYSSARKSPHTSVPRMPRSANNMSISNRHLCDSFHSLLCLSERDGLCGLWGLSFIRSDLPTPATAALDTTHLFLSQNCRLLRPPGLLLICFHCFVLTGRTAATL